MGRRVKNEFTVKREYRWRPGFVLQNMKGLDVQAIGESIERLMEEKGHRVKADDVVHAATDPTSPLHDAFEWEDTEAARQWRDEQARRLLRSYTITIVRENRPDVVIRANMSVEEPTNPRESTYGGTVELMGDEEMRGLLLKQAINKLIAFKRSYGQLQELAQVFAVIDKLAKKIA